MGAWGDQLAVTSGSAIGSFNVYGSGGAIGSRPVKGRARGWGWGWGVRRDNVPAQSISGRDVQCGFERDSAPRTKIIEICLFCLFIYFFF